MREFFFKSFILILLFFKQYSVAQTEGVVYYTYFQDLGVPGYMDAALYFNNEKAVYYKAQFQYNNQQVELDPGARLVKEFDDDDISDKLLLKCVLLPSSDELICVESPIDSKPYYVKEKTPKIKWEIADTTRLIENYRVQKATGFFRGRTYHVWFAPEIPVPYGPWKLMGLPGLILEAQDDSGRVKFLFKGIRNAPTQIEKIDFGKYSSVDIVSFQEIDKKAVIDYRKKTMAQLGIRDAQLMETKEPPDELKLEFDFEWEKKPPPEKGNKP